MRLGRSIAVGACVLIPALGATPVPCKSQGAPLGFLDKVFATITDINGSVISGSPIANRGVVTGNLNGLGVEVIVDLGSVGASTCPKADTTLTQLSVHVGPGGADTTRTYAVAAKPRTPGCTDHPWVDAQLGFGYTRVGGFRNESLSMQGSVEELPVVAFYATLNTPVLEPYAGVHGGLTQMTNFRAMSGDSAIKGSGTTFEYGVNLGLSAAPFLPGGRWAVFVELAWTFRTFDGVDWGRVPPPALQAPLRLSAFTAAIGGQIKFGPASRP